MKLRERAEIAFPDKPGQSEDMTLAARLGHMRGFAEAIELAAEKCESERALYEESMREFDKRGDTRMGTNEARSAVTASLLADAIRALAQEDGE